MGNELFDCQTTLRTPVSVSGVGVHRGKPVSVHFSPADPDTGVVFHGPADGDEYREIRANAAAIGGTDLCTVLGDPSGFHVGTVEHLMATLLALGIDNVHIEIDGNEMPILDGSAAMFMDAFDQAGVEAQAVRRRYIRVLKPIRIEHGASWAEFRPYDGTRFEIEIDFESPAIGRQTFERDIDVQVFRRDIARARTFGFLKDVERLWAAGYALGSSLENTVVIGEDHRIINIEGLRFRDEFVRHKTLDAMGDLALAGARFIGLFRSYRGGHKLNAAALRQLLSDSSAFEIVETVRRERGRSAEMVQVSAPVYAPWAI
ncbi:MAG: UDP-3-O-acyl-N-acetylglucosamine deacetylase [Rhizobiaceae bacterium]